MWLVAHQQGQIAHPTACQDMPNRLALLDDRPWRGDARHVHIQRSTKQCAEQQSQDQRNPKPSEATFDRDRSLPVLRVRADNQHGDQARAVSFVASVSFPRSIELRNRRYDLEIYVIVGVDVDRMRRRRFARDVGATVGFQFVR